MVWISPHQDEAGIVEKENGKPLSSNNSDHSIIDFLVLCAGGSGTNNDYYCL